MLIQTPAPGRRLQLALNLEGAPPTPTLNPELQPVILVQDVSGIDWTDPAYDRPAGGYSSVSAGGAGVYSYVTCMNPAGSGTVLTVTGVWASMEQNLVGRFSIGFEQVAHGIYGNGQFRDSRMGKSTASPQQPVGSVIGATYSGGFPANVSGYKSVWFANSYVGIDFDNLGPWVVLPGWNLAVFHAGANQGFTASFSWTERALNPQELR